MSRKGRLTTKGKHTLIMLLTITACVTGIVFSLLLSVIDERKHASSVVHAGDTSHRMMETGRKEKDTELLTPQWLYYQSGGKTVDRNLKREIDMLMRQWTKGKLAGKELCRLIKEYLNKNDCPAEEVTMQEKAVCVFPSEKELPDYTKTLAQKDQMYQFIGIYTEGEQDANGRLLCEYWEVAIR